MTPETRHLPKAPTRRPTSAGAESPERRVRSIVHAALFGGLDADGAAVRLRPVLDGAATNEARARLERDFRAVMALRRSPPEAVDQAAQAVKWFADRAGACFRLTARAPFWVTTDAQTRLYLLALVLGCSGRTFGMAKNRTGAAFGIDGNVVGHFIRKAKRNGFLVELPARQAEPGRWRPMAVYQLGDGWRTELEGVEALAMYAGDQLPWIFADAFSDEERVRLADDILMRARVHAYRERFTPARIGNATRIGNTARIGNVPYDK